MSPVARVGQVFLVLFGLLDIVFFTSVYASTDEPFPADAHALIATWGIGSGLLLIALAWAALWVAPAFLAAHVVLLGTWLVTVGCRSLPCTRVLCVPTACNAG